ncbi:hypothetical protein [Streptomyces sp. CCNWLW230]|uniref:hypothetical protein n=1 Tax=Streptomyces sp. CCNWLW230 TaxID=3127464 RepID=UPI0030775579
MQELFCELLGRETEETSAALTHLLPMEDRGLAGAGRHQLQAQIHGGEAPPSERVMAEHGAMFGREYRVQSEGEYPDPAQREK